MTNLAALQSMVEYDNDDLLSKALTDRGVSSSATYSAANQQSVELAAADIYLVLLNHPDFREGSKSIAYKPGALMALRNRILAKYGMSDNTIKVPMDTRYNKAW